MHVANILEMLSQSWYYKKDCNSLTNCWRYLQHDARTKPNITGNLQAVELNNTWNRFEATEEAPNLPLHEERRPSYLHLEL
jgi:hypothetical protein